MYKWRFTKYGVNIYNPILVRIDVMEAIEFFKNKRQVQNQEGLIVTLNNKNYVIESQYMWIDFIEKGYIDESVN
jgi:hypothetical protein